MAINKLSAGGSKCTYAGKDYSPGSAVKQDDGHYYVCEPDGTWEYWGEAPYPPGRPAGGWFEWRLSPYRVVAAALALVLVMVIALRALKPE